MTAWTFFPPLPPTRRKGSRAMKEYEFRPLGSIRTSPSANLCTGLHKGFETGEGEGGAYGMNRSTSAKLGQGCKSASISLFVQREIIS